MNKKYCEWCDSQFNATVNYQIYCSPECREYATREKITQRYLVKKRNNKNRKSKRCRSCGNILSVYNDESICNGCSINPAEVNKALKEIKEILDENS
jgi:hypothetical protein